MPVLDDFTSKLYHTFKNEISVLHKSSWKIKEEEKLAHIYYEASIALIKNKTRQIKRTTRKKIKQNYTFVCIINLDINIIKKILSNSIQLYIEKV